jgi:hypothetical protein
MDATYITEAGKEEKRRKLLLFLTEDYFRRVEGAYFVVVGRARGSKQRLFNSVLLELGIHEVLKPRVVHFPKLHGANIKDITSQVSSPHCVGFVGFGLTPKQKELLKKHLTKAKVWNDYYNVLAEEDVITPEPLKSSITKILEVLFEDELDNIGP